MLTKNRPTLSIMRSFFVAFLALALLSSLVIAWECDKRCSGYDACIRGNRALGADNALEDTLLEEDNEPDTMTDADAGKNLRGATAADVHRELEDIEFSIKMYWESEYCVSAASVVA